MRKKLFCTRLLIILVCCISIPVFFTKFLLIERPMIQNPENANVIQIMYFSDSAHEMVTLESYDAAKLIEDLSKCSEKRTFRIANDGYRLDAYIVVITLRDGENLKEILLGEENSYSYGGYGSFKYEIIDSDLVLEKVKADLKVSVTK